MNELKEVIADVFSIPAESLADDLSNDGVPGWDSVGHLNLVLAIEDRFGVKFTIDEISEMTQLRKIQRLLDEKEAH